MVEFLVGGNSWVFVRGPGSRCYYRVFEAAGHAIYRVEYATFYGVFAWFHSMGLVLLVLCWVFWRRWRLRRGLGATGGTGGIAWRIVLRTPVPFWPWSGWTGMYGGGAGGACSHSIGFWMKCVSDTISASDEGASPPSPGGCMIRQWKWSPLTKLNTTILKDP